MFHEAIRRALEKGEDLEPAMAEAAGPMRQVIERMLRRQPFEPFRLNLTSRSFQEIRSPEGVVVTPTTMRIGEPDPAQPGRFRTRVLLALIHVVSLEPLPMDQPIIVQEAGPAGERSRHG